MTETEIQVAIKQARDDYMYARMLYNMLSTSDHEGALYHKMQEAWERLRAAIREAKRNAAPGEAAPNGYTKQLPSL